MQQNATRFNATNATAPANTGCPIHRGTIDEWAFAPANLLPHTTQILAASIHLEYPNSMASSVIRVAKSEAISNIASLLDSAFDGAEVVIEDGPRKVRLTSPESSGPGRLLSESIASARRRASSATIDESFAAGVQAAIEAHRELR